MITKLLRLIGFYGYSTAVCTCSKGVRCYCEAGIPEKWWIAVHNSLDRVR